MFIKSILVVPCFLIGSLVFFKTGNISETSTNPIPCETVSQSVTVSDPILVKATIYRDEVIPLVDLDEVVITPETSETKWVKAIKIGNEIIPTVDLQEVVIRPT